MTQQRETWTKFDFKSSFSKLIQPIVYQPEKETNKGTSKSNKMTDHKKQKPLQIIYNHTNTKMHALSIIPDMSCKVCTPQIKEEREKEAQQNNPNKSLEGSLPTQWKKSPKTATCTSHIDKENRWRDGKKGDSPEIFSSRLCF